MDHLLRELAPISDEAWQQIDDEARTRLSAHLSARRLVDLDGPHGWDHSARNSGHVQEVSSVPEGTEPGAVEARQRHVLPLTEVRVRFTVSRSELDDVTRGATDVDLDDVDRAARQVGLVENRAVFHGWEEAGITGIIESSGHTAQPLGADAMGYPGDVSDAVETLRGVGINGPCGLAVGEDAYTRIAESTEQGGLLLLDHLRRILGGGKIVRTPGLDGAVVVSLQDGNFALELGQDLSIGYLSHDADNVNLYLEESFTFRVLEPDAAVALTNQGVV
jgi:uncharacterized linocin/CFP29 family protein